MHHALCEQSDAAYENAAVDKPVEKYNSGDQAEEPLVDKDDEETDILSGGSYPAELARTFVTSYMHLKMMVGAVAIDRLLSPLFHESFPYGDLSTIGSSDSKCEKYLKELISSQMSHHGSKPVNHNNTNETSCAVHLIGSIYVLKQQERKADTTHRFLQYSPSPV